SEFSVPGSSHTLVGPTPGAPRNEGRLALPVERPPSRRAVYVVCSQPWSTPPRTSSVRPVGTPSPSNGSEASPPGRLPWSTNVTLEAATAAPCLPTNIERP